MPSEFIALAERVVQADIGASDEMNEASMYGAPPGGSEAGMVAGRAALVVNIPLALGCFGWRGRQHLHIDDRTPRLIQSSSDEQEAVGAWSAASVSAVVELIAGRWVLPILHSLGLGPLRRNALRVQVGTISDKVLTDTLRRMADDTFILRTAIASVPVEVDYPLTGSLGRCGRY